MEKDTKDGNKENNRKSVRSKYRTEYSGDHVSATVAKSLQLVFRS